MSETKGRGVDLILNSLAEQKLQASVRCLAPQGKFLEIGVFDIANNNTLGRLYFINFLLYFMLV
jgi:fatty acid synthase